MGTIALLLAIGKLGGAEAVVTAIGPGWCPAGAVHVDGAMHAAAYIAGAMLGRTHVDGAMIGTTLETET